MSKDKVEEKKKDVAIKDLLTKAELRKIENFLVGNQPEKLREYLNKDKRKAKLQKKGVVADQLFGWFVNSAMHAIKEKNNKLRKEEEKKHKQYERYIEQNPGKGKPQEESS